MRAGGCTVQQTLTTEAASVLKHSLSLARRRGHAQITPLHVAATLLMSSRATTVLRRACLKSQPLPSHGGQNSHIGPLQYCRALELCFNVALNRLPTNPGPLLHGQPSLSNALIAALKRAQAHQRRGCIENQQQQNQQPLLAIKVELEQLILSILDDPSVSRVMREAGFSSTAVKNNLEEDSSNSAVFFTSSGNGGGVYSSPSSPNNNSPSNDLNFWQRQTHFLNYSSEQNPLFISPQKKVYTSDSLKEVMEVLLGKKRRKNTVIVGDSVSVTEGLVLELMGKVERGDVPEELKSTHFIKFQFSSVPLKFMKREEVEMNISDLKKKVDSLSLSSTTGGGGVIIYAGDLKWTVDEREEFHSGNNNNNNIGYNPVDDLVVEIGRLVSQYSNSSSKKIWLMGTANYQTYMRCQMKQPSLEVQWSLQAVSVPSGGLGLSLNTTSVHDTRINLSNSTCQLLDRKALSSKEEGDILTCCPECTSNYEKESTLFKSSSLANNLDIKASTILPHWLHSTTSSETLQKEDLGELRRKWNRLCHSLHQGRHTQNNYMASSPSLNNNQCLIGKTHSSYTSSYPFWPNNNNHNINNSSSISFSVPRFRRQQSCHIEFSFGNGNHSSKLEEPNLDCLKSREEGKEEVKITLALGNSLSSDSAKMVSSRGEDMCKFLQENVPWQIERIPSIVEVLVNENSNKKDTWLLIEGNDSIGKQRLSLAIAEAAFGSTELFLSMNMREKESNKPGHCCKKLKMALRDQENLVVLVEDVDFGDGQFVKFLNDGFENGKFGENGRVIFILTKGSDHNRPIDGGKTNPIFAIQMELRELRGHETKITGLDRKRRPDWDLSSKSKVPRIENKDSNIIAMENGNMMINKEGLVLSRQSSSNTLDLNIQAHDDNGEDNDESPLWFSPNSSDLTRETENGPGNPFGFLERVERGFVFDRSPARDSLMREKFLSKMKGVFKDVFGSESSLDVENGVLEGVLFGCGSYLNGLFEKWLLDVFQTSLETVKNGGKGESVSLRLCLVEEKWGGIEEVGFMGSNLPKNIKLCFM